MDAAFEQHIRNDHQPWRRDCEHCVAGGLQGRLHKRVSCPEGFALSLDLLGKYDPGPSELHKVVNWCLIGCFVVPHLSVGAEDRQTHDLPEGNPDPTSGLDPGPSGLDPNLSGLDPGPSGLDPNLNGLEPDPSGLDPNPSGLVDPLVSFVPKSSTSPKVVDSNPCDFEVTTPPVPRDPPRESADSGYWNDADLEGYEPSEADGGSPSVPVPALHPNPPRSITSPDDTAAEKAMHEEWERKAAGLKLSSSPMHELHFVVPIPNKSETSVLDAVALVLTQIQALGYQCIRVHSDKGREFANKRFRNFLRLRGIYKTTSEGDDYKGNGRVEGAIRRLKQQARVLLHASGLDHKYWAFALQHAAARQRATMLPRLGGVARALLPFGSRVFVRRRTWDQRCQRWQARGIQGTVLAPSLEVTRGHVVMLSTGELMTTSTLLIMRQPAADSCDAPSSSSVPSDLPVLEPSEDIPPSLRHRITSKRRVATAVRDVLREENQCAQALAAQPVLDCDRAIAFLLESRWLRKATSPSQRSILVGGHSHVFGLFRHGGVVGITTESQECTGFLRLLHSFVRAVAPSFQYTSLTLLSQVKSLPHRDLGNVPGTCSLLLPLVMPPSGGHLWVEDPAGNLQYELPSGLSCWGRHVPLLPLRPVQVDPTKYHATQDWEHGHRLVLVAYHLRAIRTASAALRASLCELGFPLPDSPSGVPAKPGSCQGGGEVRESLSKALNEEKPCVSQRPEACVPEGTMQPRLAALRLPQHDSSSSGAGTGSNGTQSSGSATQSQFQSSAQPSSSSGPSSRHTSVQPPTSEHLEEMTLGELIGSLTPRSQHYLHSRARAYSRGLRFVGEDRVSQILSEIVRRDELSFVILSAEELEEEATRVVPRPVGYPSPYDTASASASAVTQPFMPLPEHGEASEAEEFHTLPMPLPSRDQASSVGDVSSGGRPGQLVPETWSDFDVQEAYMQADVSPGNTRYVADPFEEPDELEEEPAGPFMGPHPCQWTEVTERVALMWMQDPAGTASELGTLQPNLFWRDLEDDPLLYHIVTEYPDPPPHRIYEEDQLITVIRHWIRGGLHRTLCVLDIPEVNPWFLAEETRHIIIRSRYSPGGDFVHLLPVAARAAAVRISTVGSGLHEVSNSGQAAEEAPGTTGVAPGFSEVPDAEHAATATSRIVSGCALLDNRSSVDETGVSIMCPIASSEFESGTSDPSPLLQEFCAGWVSSPGQLAEIDWDSEVHVVPSNVSRLSKAIGSPEDCEGVPDEYDVLVCEVPVGVEEAGVSWLDHAQARLQAVIRAEGKQCLEEAVAESEGWIDSCFRLRSVARQVEVAIEDLENHGREHRLGEVDLNPCGAASSPDPEVLQTKIIPNHQVEREIAQWLPSMKDEYNGLMKAVDPLPEQVVRQWEAEGREFELIPSKLIFSLKAPDARRKCRSVCCGNFTSGTSSREDKYSGGIDSVTMRCLLRFAGLMRFNVAVIDVKQAFLLAPLLSNGVPVVVKTPTIFRRHGICDERFWIVRHALYGLVQAPKSWSVHRDSVISEMEICMPDGQAARVSQLASDPNVWEVRSPAGVQAWVAIYVDDLMIVGHTSAVECVLDEITRKWKCTPAQRLFDGPISFNGFELSLSTEGIVVHQGRYAQEILTRYPGEASQQTPGEGAWPDALEGENERPDYVQKVRNAQRPCGSRDPQGTCDSETSSCS